MSFQGTSSSSSHSSKSKLNQVVQNFFSKATQVVVQARLNPRAREKSDKHKLNKWFNLETDELEAYRDDLKLWRSIDIYTVDKMPPVVVETYLDMRHLSPNQTLVLEDASGKRWNASFGGRKTEVVLERWVIEIQRPEHSQSSPASSTELPMAYKKCILLFRALYTYCRLLPAWTLQKRLSKSKLSTSPLRIGCRVLNGSQPISSRGRVGLSKLIAGSSEQHLQTFSFDPVEIPSGVFKISVSYRVNTNFAVDDSEAMLSSQFLRIDEEKPVQAASAVKHPSMAAPNLHYITGLPRRHSGAVVPTSVSSVTGDYMERRRSSGASGAVGVSAGSGGVSGASTGSGGVSGASGGSGGASGGSGGSVWGEHGSPGGEKAVTASPGVSASPSTPPFPRVPSSSSLAALRIPRRTISNSSTSSARVATTPGYTPSAYEQAISSSGGSSRSGSIPKYSSSFGTRQWNRSGSISSSRRRNSMLVGSAESAISSGSSLMEPGSGFIDIEDPSDVSDFVKMVDSIKPGSPYSLGSPRKPSDPLARFQQLKGSHAGIADSITSSIYQPGFGGVGKSPYVRSKLSGESNLESNLESEAVSSVPRPLTVPPSPRKMESMQPISLADQHTSEYQQLQQRVSARPHSYSERDQLDNSHYKALERYDLGGAGVVGSRYYTEQDRGRGERRYSAAPLPGLEFEEDDDLLFAMSDMRT
ncbi:Autophagy-related protein 13 [Yarrowia sp. B02]|nr:Autophagy-related protein 13 [Yarrowia sp. B02]